MQKSKQKYMKFGCELANVGCADIWSSAVDAEHRNRVIDIHSGAMKIAYA